MNFKYYFSAFAICGAFILSSCENKPASSSEEPDSPVHRLNCPDSVLVYDIAEDGTEKLSCVWHCQYDTNGNNTKRVRYSAHDFSVADGKIEMRYDAQNNLLERQEWWSFAGYEEKYLLKSTQWVMTYNSEGKMATMQMNFWYGDEESEPSKNAVYTWPDNCHATADIYAYNYMGDPTDWKLVDKAEYTYTNHGDIAYEKYTFQYYISESARNNPIEYFYEYDQHDNVISYKLVNSGSLEQYDTYSYTYDAEGNILVKYIYTNSSGEPVLKSKEVSSYLSLPDVH